MRKAAVILFSLLWLSGCRTMPAVARPSLENAGGIFLYVQPFPKEAERLRFSLEGVSVVTDNGQEIPLSLSFKDFNSDTLGRQRLLAFFTLPPGAYSGFSFRVKSAELKTKEGTAALLVPEGPVSVDFNFRVERKRAYVMQLASNYGEAVDNVTFSPVFRLFIPERPLTGLTGYVSNYGSNAITVFDKKGMEVSGAIAEERGPRAMVIDPLQLKAYVAIADEDAVDIIDLLSGNVINRLRIAPGDDPREVALTPDGRVLLTANYGTKTVSFIDTSHFMELQRVIVGDNPRSLLIDGTGRRAYVLNSYSSTMSVIDIPRMAVVATVPTELDPVRGQFNRRGDRLYIISSGSSYLSVIDIGTLSIVKRVFVGMGASSFKVDSRTDLLYVGRRHDDGVTVYNPVTFTPTQFIRVGGPVSYMTIDGEENNLYLVIPQRRMVAVVNLISREVVGKIDVGEEPFWVTMMGER